MRCEKPVRRIVAKKASTETTAKIITVKLDESQMLEITDLLNEARISIDDICLEPQIQNSDDAEMHTPSLLMKNVLAASFIMVFVALIYGLTNSWNAIVEASNLFTAIISAVFLFIVALASLVIGLSIRKESSKTYIVSLFSAVVALAALGVALFK